MADPAAPRAKPTAQSNDDASTGASEVVKIKPGA